MKALVIGFLALSASLFQPAAAQSATEPTPAPTAFAEAPRPLLHYLIRTLSLHDQQALRVAETLKTHPQQLATPADLELVLQPLLSARQATHLQALEQSGELLSQLHLLATLH